MTLESNKISVLLGALDFSPDVGQKTLIVTNSSQEVEDVFKVRIILSVCPVWLMFAFSMLMYLGASDCF